MPDSVTQIEVLPLALRSMAGGSPRSVIADASEAILMSSRSRRSALADMTARRSHA